jgi:DNA-binding SARP family transcriptional activator/tetratricopeptide (TPR) repeat protein
MGLNLLGPLELVVAGRSIDLGAPRTKVVLSTLAINWNRVTPVEQLVDAVWENNPPETARTQIQVCVSALRKVFAETGAPAAIRTRAPGYVLEADDGFLDFVGFERLVETARIEVDESTAAQTLRSALAMWRGSALAGVRSRPLERWAVAWNEQRMEAVESLMALELALGRHRHVLGELRLYVAEHPWRERLCGFLALALYRSGRQAEALEVCARARTVLVEELGIDPSEELRDLERAILTQDGSLDVAPARPRQQPAGVVPRQLPARLADFTGRNEQVAAVTRRRLSNGVLLVAISGTGGVGKTSLAIHLGYELATEFPDGQLYVDVRNATSPDVVARVLAAFLRGLGFDGSVIPDDADERAAMYRNRLADRRVLVVLDGVANEEQVERLLPGGDGCLVIVTSRPRLGGLAGAFQIALEPLDSETSIELLEKIVGRERVEAERPAASSLAGLCEGLPLALRIAGARLASRPHWSIGELATRMTDDARRLDELTHHGLEFRSVIATTYRSLKEPARRLLRLLALVRTTDFPSWPAAALLGSGLDVAEGLLDDLVDVHLLTVAPPGRTGRRYRLHDLVRAFAAERLASTESAPERDDALRRLLGGWIALVEDVHRADYGGDYTVLHGRAPRWRTDGGWTVSPDGSPYDVLEVERRALVDAVRTAADARLDELCWELAHSVVGLFELKGYYDDWRETTALALAATERAGNRIGRTVMLYTLGNLHLNQQRFDEAVPPLTEALAGFRADGMAQGVGLALSRLAYVHGRRGDDRAMANGYAEAMTAFRDAGDRGGEAGVLHSLARYELSRGDLAAARQLLADGLRIVEETGAVRGAAQILHQFAELYDRSGETALAKRTRQDVLRRVRQLGDDIGEVYALYGLAATLFRAGEAAAAKVALAEGLDLALLRGERFVEARARLAWGEVAADEGQLDDAEWELAQAEKLFADIGSIPLQAQALLSLAAVQVQLGRVDPAADSLDRARRLRSALDAAAASDFDARMRELGSVLPAS